jgi:hypothetical protein
MVTLLTQKTINTGKKIAGKEKENQKKWSIDFDNPHLSLSLQPKKRIHGKSRSNPKRCSSKHQTQ